MPEAQPATPIRWSAIVKVIVILLLLVISNIIARDVIESLDFEIRPGNEDAVHRTIMLSAAAYALTLAIPFVPGAEIGVALMVMLGPPIAVLVYLCTLAGLSISYALGRFIPLSVLARLADDCKLERTGLMLREIGSLDKKQRLELLLDRAPRRILPWLLRYRYLALAVALNIPGNYLIGGGGGIALFAGVSRIFGVAGFLLTIVLAVAPVPLAVLMFGSGILSG